jgi:DNA-dependent RNA polymerase auxiliary subunit epsilon
LGKDPESYYYTRNAYHNESVADQVKKVFEKNQILEYNNEFIQQIDPIFLDPQPDNFFGFRSHFFAPRKYFAGQYWNTYWFNLVFVWALTLFFYVTLYFNALKRLLDLPEKFQRKK